MLPLGRYFVRAASVLWVLLLSLIVAGCGGGGGGTQLTLQSIEVTPSNPQAAAGTQMQFAATGIYSDGSHKDVTSAAVWSASNGNAVAVTQTGLASAEAPGIATISATIGQVAGSTQLTVTPAALVSIGVTPGNPNLPSGIPQQFTATGVFTDNSTQDLTSQVVWSSSNTAVATVSNSAGSNGLANTLNVGSATISASSGGVSGSTTLTVTAATLVSISVTPPSPSVAKGVPQQFTATGIYTDNSTQNLTAQVTWASSNTGVAAISNASGSNGLATSTGVGTSTIGASIGNVSGTATLTVTSAVVTALGISPTNPSAPKGTTQQFAATATFSDNSTQDVTAAATWTSDNTAVAGVSNATGSNGLASAVATGPANISAAYSGQSATTTLTVTAAVLSSVSVTPAASVIAKGTSQQFKASAVYSDGSNQDVTGAATWASDTQSVATVSNASGSQGRAVAQNVGQANVSASYGGMNGAAPLKVVAAVNSVAVTPANPTIANGTTRQFTATATLSDNSTQDVTAQATWTSSDNSVASISNASGSNGLATAAKAGNVTIQAQYQGQSGSTALAVSTATLAGIQVQAAKSKLPQGFTLQFTATGTYSDGSKQDITRQVAWASTNTGTATVSNASGSNGLATGVSPGSVTVSAALGGAVGSASLSITNATLSSIGVTPASPAIPSGTSQAFDAVGTFSDNSTLDLTTQASWSSSNTGVASISNSSGSNGLASGVAPGGPVTITAQSGSVSGTAKLTISAAALTAISVASANNAAQVPKGETLQYSATGVYSDNSTKDLTTSVTWVSSTQSVATVSNASGSQGLATGAGTGSTAITASSGSITSNSVSLVVSAAALQSIAIAPANPSVPLGLKQQFSAIGTYSDGSHSDITAQVTWTSSNSAVATISNTSGSQGQAQTLATGTATIGAQLNGVSQSTTLTVTSAALQSIAVTPANATIPAATQQPYTAKGSYSDGSTLDLTTQVTWSSSNTALADVSNGTSSNGLVTTKSQGSVTIKAVDPSSGVAGSTGLNVSAALLKSIVVMEATDSAHNGHIPAGFAASFTATGIYGDNSTQDLTGSASWSVADSSIATNSNNVVTGQKAGSTTLTASAKDANDNPVNGTLALTVTSATLQSIAVTPTTASITAGGSTQQYDALGSFSGDGSSAQTLDLTKAQVNWSSSMTLTATINAQGLATSGAVPGNSNITASKGSVTSNTAVLTVTP